MQTTQKASGPEFLADYKKTVDYIVRNYQVNNREDAKMILMYIYKGDFDGLYKCKTIEYCDLHTASLDLEILKLPMKYKADYFQKFKPEVQNDPEVALLGVTDDIFNYTLINDSATKEKIRNTIMSTPIESRTTFNGDKLKYNESKRDAVRQLHLISFLSLDELLFINYRHQLDTKNILSWAERVDTMLPQLAKLVLDNRDDYNHIVAKIKLIEFLNNDKLQHTTINKDLVKKSLQATEEFLFNRAVFDMTKYGSKLCDGEDELRIIVNLDICSLNMKCSDEVLKKAYLDAQLELDQKYKDRFTKSYKNYITDSIR